MADLSFLPEDYLERKIQRRTNIISLALFVVVMAGLVGAFFVTDRARMEVRANQKQVNTDFQKAADMLAQLDQLQARKQQMIHKAQVTGVLLEKVPRSLILSELVNNMPATLSLTEVTLETSVLQNARPRSATLLDEAKKANAKAAEEPQVPQTEVKLQIAGLAPTDVEVAQLMASLGQCKLFAELDLAFSEETTVNDRTMRKFKVDMKLNQDVDLRQFEPKIANRGLKQNPMAGPAAPAKAEKGPPPIILFGKQTDGPAVVPAASPTPPYKPKE